MARLWARPFGGLFETVLGFFLKPLRKFFGGRYRHGRAEYRSVADLGRHNSFGGGNVLRRISARWKICYWRCSCAGGYSGRQARRQGLPWLVRDLVGIIAGYIAAIIMGLVLPTTAVDADGVEFTRHGYSTGSSTGRLVYPSKLMPVKPVFDLRAILPVLVMFLLLPQSRLSAIFRALWKAAWAVRQPTRSCPAVQPATVSARRLRRCSVLAEHLGPLQNVGLVTGDQGCQSRRTVRWRNLPHFMRPDFEAGRDVIHYAAVRARRCGCYDVLVHRNQRYSSSSP